VYSQAVDISLPCDAVLVNKLLKDTERRINLQVLLYETTNVKIIKFSTY